MIRVSECRERVVEAKIEKRKRARNKEERATKETERARNRAEMGGLSHHPVCDHSLLVSFS
jgi:hypothetical protein